MHELIVLHRQDYHYLRYYARAYACVPLIEATDTEIR